MLKGRFEKNKKIYQAVHLQVVLPFLKNLRNVHQLWVGSLFSSFLIRILCFVMQQLIQRQHSLLLYLHQNSVRQYGLTHLERFHWLAQRF